VSIVFLITSTFSLLYGFNKDYKIEFGKFDFARVKEIMLEHEFSDERVESQFEKIKALNEQKKQRTLF
jgi:hypothetical protein